MNDMDDTDLKLEINAIMENVANIMKKIETLDPAKKNDSGTSEENNK
ncbi:MAG: hypothetical protein HKM93_02965 [Desulfobacteraceae bacterium]|nr:hypothetical protein [Desulfobacteraceae bacterium]